MCCCYSCSLNSPQHAGPLQLKTVKLQLKQAGLYLQPSSTCLQTSGQQRLVDPQALRFLFNKQLLYTSQRQLRTALCPAGPPYLQ